MSAAQRALICRGVELRAARLGISVTAACAQIGMSAGNFSNFKYDRRQLTAIVLKRIADWLHRTRPAKPPAT